MKDKLKNRSRQKHGYLWPMVQVDPEDRHLLDEMPWSIWKHRRTYYVVGTDKVDGKNKHRKLHRLILGCAPGVEVDHINGDGLDNRRANLRVCTRAENARNQRPLRGGTSRYKGVCWDRRARKWHAQITVDGRRKYLGLFTDELSAARAYDDAARRLFGEFARPNEPSLTYLTALPISEACRDYPRPSTT